MSDKKTATNPTPNGDKRTDHPRSPQDKNIPKPQTGYPKPTGPVK